MPLNSRFNPRFNPNLNPRFNPNVDIGYIPTPTELIHVLLDFAQMGSEDVFYDLGSGDGRVPIAASQRFGCRSVGIEIDSQYRNIAQLKAEDLGLSDRVIFRDENLFECDFSEASIVYVYLLPHLNIRLRPQLWQQLKPGSRVISRDFDMGDWQPERCLDVMALEEDEPEEVRFFAWTITS